MDLLVGQVVKLKKPHPCGANEWTIIRVGMDFKLRCNGCDHLVMLPRKTVEASIKGILYTPEQ